MLMLRKINNMKILETDRLILRTWNDNDLQGTHEKIQEQIFPIFHTIMEQNIYKND